MSSLHQVDFMRDSSLRRNPSQWTEKVSELVDDRPHPLRYWERLFVCLVFPFSFCLVLWLCPLLALSQGELEHAFVCSSLFAWAELVCDCPLLFHWEYE